MESLHLTHFKLIVYDFFPFLMGGVVGERKRRIEGVCGNIFKNSLFTTL